jgi:putative spermidine/putrescine transport system substrate-binding protein
MKKIILLLFLCSLMMACYNATTTSPQDPSQLNWKDIEQKAAGTTVQMTMWQGDPFINRYMQDYVVPELKQRYQIDLQLNTGQGNALVKMMMAEKESQQHTSATDLCWINGETFFQLRQIDALYGPFTQQLPNSQYIDFDNPFIGIDFQQKVDGFECPWGNVQECIIFDSVRTPAPPRNLQDLEAYVQAHPGKWTIPYEFTGMTLLKAWLIALSGDKNALSGDFDEEKYKAASSQLWAYINRIKPYFWRKGETFPENLATMHQMFANGELDFTLSNNDAEVDNKILQNIFPGTTKAYVFETGTIQNSHYLGIPKLSGNKIGAMVVTNFMISPEAQYRKYMPSVWGDGTVLDIQKLPQDWQLKFNNLPERQHAPKRKDIQPYALREPAPEYMVRLFDDFRKYVIDQR